jgi:TonB family protein
MSDPRRLLDDVDRADPRADLRRALLRAGRDQRAPGAVRARVVDALGLGEGAAIAAPEALEARRDRPADWRSGRSLFDAFLPGDGAHARRFGAGAAAAAAVHLAVIGLLIFGARGHEGGAAFHAGESGSAVPVRFDVGAARPGDPPAGPVPEAITASPERADPAPPARPAAAPTGTHPPAAILAGPSEAPAATIPEAPPAPVVAEPEKAAAAPGVDGVLPFGEGMSRPRLLEGPEPVYPREAREARVTGTLRARCVITTTGALRGCRVVESLPFLDQPVLEALSKRRYAPVMFQGRAVNVEYEIPFRFELP